MWSREYLVAWGKLNQARSKKWWKFTLDKYISNKIHNKNVKNTHALRAVANPVFHSPPSYVACEIDARTAYIVTRYDIANLPYPMAILNSIYWRVIESPHGHTWLRYTQFLRQFRMPHMTGENGILDLRLLLVHEYSLCFCYEFCCLCIYPVNFLHFLCSSDLPLYGCMDVEMLLMWKLIEIQ